MWQFAASVIVLLCTASCTTARFAHIDTGRDCHATPELLAKVRYKPDPTHPSRIDVQCAACDDVYVAAQHDWLRLNYPGRHWVEHYSAVPVVGAPDSELEESCFRVPVDPDEIKTICFTNAGRCDREPS
jgi:hypothetical protein